MGTLSWYGPDGTRRQIEPFDAMTVGRDAACSIVLADPTVSRLHAEFVLQEDGELVLEDRRSKFGLFVDEARVPRVELTEGVRIRIGATTLRYTTHSLTARAVQASSAPIFASAEQIDDVAELRRRYELLRATYELTRTVGVEHDIERMLDRILETAFKLLSAERGSIVLLDEAGAQTSSVARDRGGVQKETQISATMLEEVVRTKMGLVAADAGSDARFGRSASICLRGVRSAMYVPLVYEETVLGVIHVDSSVAANVFTDADLELFTTIASQAALALRASTMRKEVARVREDERRRLELILEALPIGVVLLGPDREVLRSNPSALAALTQLGAAPSAPLRALGDWQLDDVVAASQRGPIDIVAERPRAIFQVVAVQHQELLIIALADVTLVRDRAAQAAQAERLALVGQLSGGIAHDFNNFLAVIRNNVELLIEDVRTPNSTDDLLYGLDVIEQAADRGAKLTHQLLTFSRHRAGEPAATDIGALATGLEPILRRAVRDHELALDVHGDLPDAWLDPSQVEQVLMNLVVNARDASEPDTRITLRVHGADVGRPGVLIEVEDEGAGIPDEIREHIFEPFFTTKAVGRGTGLGLSTIHGIVKAAGGRIDVRSRVGRGSIFAIWVPAMASRSKSA